MSISWVWYNQSFLMNFVSEKEYKPISEKKVNKKNL